MSARCRTARVLGVAALLALWGRPAHADPLEPELVERLTPSVVRIEVQGVAEGRVCTVIGSGFFVDGHGHILTAGHNVLPCEGGSWAATPQIRVRIRGQAEPVTAVLIYADHQTDLALMRANVAASAPLPLAGPGALRRHEDVSVLVFEQDMAEPAPKAARVESLFNPNEHHKGLIDISGPDMEQSASGGALCGTQGAVAAVFTKGRLHTGEAAVPIGYAAPLLQMIGVSYPSGEVREVVEELRRDLVSWDAHFEGGNLIVNYKKRLRAGASPAKIHASFQIYTDGGRFSPDDCCRIYSQTITPRPVPGKKGRHVFPGVFKAIDEVIERANEHAEAENMPRLGPKTRAEVTIETEFFDQIPVLQHREVLAFEP